MRQAVPPDFPAVRKQLQTHRNLTLQLLWEEYREENPEGYSYSRYVADVFMLSSNAGPQAFCSSTAPYSNIAFAWALHWPNRANSCSLVVALTRLPAVSALLLPSIIGIHSSRCSPMTPRRKFEAAVRQARRPSYDEESSRVLSHDLISCSKADRDHCQIAGAAR